jgi:hypothetical protein
MKGHSWHSPCAFLLLTFVVVAPSIACRVFTPAPTAVRRHTPTHTPRPSFTPVTHNAATDTPAPSDTHAPPVAPSATGEPVKTVPPAAPPTRRPTAVPTEAPSPLAPTIAPQPPREGGSWDFENGFFARASGFEGRVDYVGNEWDYFRHRGQFGQPTFNENKNPVNVRRGVRSQEIAFESSDGDAGIFRTIDVIPNHRYLISAWGIHYPSPTPIELDLGVDLTGGVDSRARTIQWNPWLAQGEAKWLHTQVTVTATGAKMTIYLRATHRTAAPGGATLFDDVQVHDLGE